MPTEHTGAENTAEGEDRLAVRLSEIARLLQREDDSESILHEVVQAAISLIPGAEEGSISVVLDRLKVGSWAASCELPRIVDAAQEETGEGPCLDAAYEHKNVHVPDMRNEPRWPEFAKRASAAGAQSMLALQLYVEGDNLGALNLYSRQANAFDDESEHVGLLVAAHAAVAWAEARKIDQLGEAIQTRDLVGQAKGILMERYDINGQQAFHLLTRISQTMNIRLRRVAEELVATGELVGHRR